MYERITLIGIGLIGGSLAAVLKKHHPDLHVTGCDVADVLDAALDRGLIDTAEPDPELAVRDADLVVLATPVGAMAAVLDAIAPALRPGAVVTDVGSVKAPVVRHAQAVLGASNPFVGGHPMAGSERSGVAAADPFLFENATYVLCPSAGQDASTFRTEHASLLGLVQSTGARIMLLEPERHDRIAAAVSHVPQLVAVALMNTAAELNRDDPAFLRLAAGGFRDMTRIAASSYDIWDDILLANRGPITDALDRLKDRIGTQRGMIDAGEARTLAADFRTARHARRSIPRDMRGFLKPLADVYVYAEDRPGFLFHLTRVVFEAGLNIKDIELTKIREGTGGAFRLGFDDGEKANQAVAILEAAGYTAYRL